MSLLAAIPFLNISGWACTGLFFFVGAVFAAASPGAARDRQLTHDPKGHVLTNINVWSPDGAWIVYDTRTGDDFNGTTIERVNIANGRVQQLYTARGGARCGVVTCNPKDGRVVFIHGPDHPTADWSYSFTRRRGMLVSPDHPGSGRPLDAMNYVPPFQPGALRGGSHVHVFSPDGKWVSFTYEDDVLAQLDAGPNSPPHQPNQRNVGVAVPANQVRVAHGFSHNNDGDYFSVVITRTVPQPKPGSDEISRAFEEGWVGMDGYRRADGSRQRHALVFQGLVVAENGRQHAEVFIVDLPDDLMRAGDAPLQGTNTTCPAPPKDTEQRRLTFTAGRKYPGVAAEPRHWLRVSPDGEWIAFLMRDENGRAQLWVVSPRGGEPRQVTHDDAAICSAITWSPDNRFIAHLMDGSVCVTELATGKTRRLTHSISGAAGPSATACVFSPDGRSIAYTRPVTDSAGTFPQIFVVGVPGS